MSDDPAVRFLFFYVLGVGVILPTSAAAYLEWRDSRRKRATTSNLRVHAGLHHNVQVLHRNEIPR
jgi:hypothetical protein